MYDTKSSNYIVGQSRGKPVLHIQIENENEVIFRFSFFLIIGL